MNAWESFALMEVLKRIRREDPALWQKILEYGLQPKAPQSVVQPQSQEERWTNP